MRNTGRENRSANMTMFYLVQYLYGWLSLCSKKNPPFYYDLEYTPPLPPFPTTKLRRTREARAAVALSGLTRGRVGLHCWWRSGC